MEKHRKPPGPRRKALGERCPECGSPKWYIQDGLRFCSRGHQAEGFIQFDADEEQDADPHRAISRKDKEIRKPESRQLSGAKGRTLFLEAMQLLLRNQISWLISKKGYAAELETVIRDLWDLRIRGYSAVSPTDDATAQGELEMFSSSTPPTTEEPSASKSRSRAQNWDPEHRIDWPMPRLPQTLALCYLGSLLLRIPMRQGELLDWVNKGGMPFKTVFQDLPREMQDRMPSPYVQVLKLWLHSGLRGEELSTAVTDLVLSYQLNYNLQFPELCHVPMLVDYSKLLALPVESVIAAKRIATVLNQRFRFPSRPTRISTLYHPEARLVSLLIVATKLCFSFKTGLPSLPGHCRFYLPRLNWESWTHGMSQLLQDGVLFNREPNFQGITPQQVVHMSNAEFEAYLSHAMRNVKSNNPDAIANLFPVETSFVPTSLNSTERSDEEMHQQARRVLDDALELPAENEVPSTPSTSLPTIKAYEAFPSVEDLTDRSAALYKAAGDAAGIPLDALVKEVYGLEKAVISWQKLRRKDDSIQDRSE